jgi:hypothetical protein
MSTASATMGSSAAAAAAAEATEQLRRATTPRGRAKSPSGEALLSTRQARGQMYGGGGGGGGGEVSHYRPTEFYHGTSLEAILAIQDSGFRVDLSGTNAGAMLGPGVYITTTLAKALNYAKGNAGSLNPAAGGVFQLEVDLGRCYTVRSNTRGERKGWASQGYDSAWAAAGIIGEMEENCVRDPARIRIRNVVLGNTGEAERLGYVVRDGRLGVSAKRAHKGRPRSPSPARRRSKPARKPVSRSPSPAAPKSKTKRKKTVSDFLQDMVKGVAVCCQFACGMMLAGICCAWIGAFFYHLTILVSVQDTPTEDIAAMCAKPSVQHSEFCKQGQSSESSLWDVLMVLWRSAASMGGAFVKACSTVADVVKAIYAVICCMYNIACWAAATGTAFVVAAWTNLYYIAATIKWFAIGLWNVVCWAAATGKGFVVGTWAAVCWLAVAFYQQVNPSQILAIAFLGMFHLASRN